MSDRALRGAALLTIAWALPLQAQHTEAELLRQIDSLAPLVEQAAIDAEAARLARLEAERARLATRVALDTISVSGMTVIAPERDVAEAGELFSEVWSESFPGFASRSVTERTFTYQRSAFDVEEIPLEGIREQIVVAPWHSREQAKARIRQSVGHAVAAELGDVAVGGWVSGNPFARRDPAGVYRELVLAQSRGVRLCLEGDVGACKSALDLAPGERMLDDWYTPEERRERVLAWAGYDAVQGRFAASLRWTEGLRLALARCFELVTADACDELIEQNEGAFVPVPVYMRETVVALAVDLGGSGSWSRLVDDPDMPPAEALAHAAGLPVDELISEWRIWVLSSRPRVYAGLGQSSALALLWALLFAALAARSTRWRFD